MSRLIDLTGQRFGRLTVVKRVGTKNGSPTWLCSCDCGNEKIVIGRNLKSRNTTSCGCYSSQTEYNGKFENLMGQTFGKLTVIEQTERKSGKIAWRCQCSCGNKTTVITAYLKSGHTRSCGCINKEVRAIDLTGQRFGKLTVIKRVENHKKKVFWLCKCDCGNVKEIAARCLSGGITKSCGCYSKERTREVRFIDLTGERFGRLTVVKHIESDDYQSKWLCKCYCGNETISLGANLRRGLSLSCGCYMAERASARRLIDLIGQKFGKYTVVERAKTQNKSAYWVCKCDCGNIRIVNGESLRTGDSMSCGCIKSTAEYNTIEYLNAHNIKYYSQKRFDDLCGIGGGKLSYDFFLPDYSLLIECQGQQHYFPVEVYGGEEQFKKQLEHDKRKREYAIAHGYELFEIPYWQYSKIENVIGEKISSM